jgi:hypothetical protein
LIFTIGKNATGKCVLHRKMEIRKENKGEEAKNEETEDGR